MSLEKQLADGRRFLERALDGNSAESVDFWRGYVEALELAVVLTGK